MDDLFGELNSFVGKKDKDVKDRFSEIKYGLVNGRPKLYINNLQLIFDSDNLLVCNYRDYHRTLFQTDVNIVKIIRSYLSLDSNCEDDILTLEDRLGDDEDVDDPDSERLEAWRERVMDNCVIPIRNYIILGALGSGLIKNTEIEEFSESLICNLFVIKVVEQASRDSYRWKAHTILINEDLITKMKRNLVGAIEFTTQINSKRLLKLI